MQSVIKTLEELKNELWCECIGDCICSCEKQKTALQTAISLCKRVNVERMIDILRASDGYHEGDRTVIEFPQGTVIKDYRKYATALFNYLTGKEE